MYQINIYLGLLDLITYDTGKNFISKEFKKYTSTIDICTKAVLVEAYNTISIVEQYYRLLRYIYQIITVEIPDIDKDIVLQIAFKAINDITNPDKLVPTLLVFGTYPQMAKLDTPSLSVTQ